MKTIERIKMLISENAKSERDFAMKIGVNQVTLNNYTANKRKLSLEIIEAILNAFPEISAEWLLRGTGAIMLNETSDSIKANDFDEAWYKKVIDDQHDTISLLKEKVKFLEKQIEEKRNVQLRLNNNESEVVSSIKYQIDSNTFFIMEETIKNVILDLQYKVDVLKREKQYLLDMCRNCETCAQRFCCQYCKNKTAKVIAIRIRRK